MKALGEWAAGAAFAVWTASISLPFWGIPPWGCPDIFWWMR